MGIAPPSDAHHVPQRCPGAGGGDADVTRLQRNLLLDRGIEQALRRQPALQRLELLVEVADPGLLHGIDVELVAAVPGKQRGRGLHAHLHAVLGLEGQSHGALAEHHALHPRARILQGEVAVAADVVLVARDLARHHHVSQQRIPRQEPAHVFVELRYAQRAIRLHLFTALPFTA